MAIAYDSSAAAGSTSTTSLSYSHTTSGSDRVLVVFAKTYSSSDLVTGITYAGVSMTKLLTGQDAGGLWSHAYILANPATGANNVVVSLSSANYIGSTSHSYTGCKTVSIPDASGSLNSSVTDVTTTLTTTVDNCWLVGSYNGGRPYTPGVGTTVRQTQLSSDYLVTFDSNGAKTPAGSYSLAGSQSTATACRNYIISLAPAPTASSQIKSADGVTLANIKSADGVVIASIKSMSSVANS